MTNKFWSGLLTYLLNDKKILYLITTLLEKLSKKSKDKDDDSIFSDMLKSIEKLSKK